MEFIDSALEEFRQKRTGLISLSGMKLPVGNDVFFRAKQSELIAQYQGARIFLSQTGTTAWDYWFTKTEPTGEKTVQLIENNYRAYFFETALLYYNIVVDLSWVMLYSAVEYRCVADGIAVDITGIQTINTAYDALRKLESITTAPINAKTSAFQYLKKLYPKCECAVDMVSSFWSKFYDSEIRQLYNFCKHRGKSIYKEIADLQGGEPFSIGIFQSPCVEQQQGTSALAFSGSKYQKIVSDTHDVQKKVVLSEEIERLLKFDNETLYPYIKQLLVEIERIVKPSPLVV